jgi:hypothetical protein
VALDGGHREGRVLAHLLGGDVGEGREAPGINSGTPSGESRGEKGGMDESDAVCQGGVGNEGMGGLGWGEVEVPEAGGRCSCAGKKQGGVPVDVELGGGECGSAAVVTELANGNEGVGSEAGKDVSLASCRGKTREVESGRVAGTEGSAIGNTDGEWRGGRVAVEVGAGHGDVVSCATGVGNG